jgi:hypothetical protein
MTRSRHLAVLTARLLAVQLVLFCFVVENVRAQDAGPAADRSEASSAPIDTNLSTGGSGWKHAHKVHDWRKFKIVRTLKDFDDHRRNQARATNLGMLRNAIGFPIGHVSDDNNATDLKAAERHFLTARPDNADPLRQKSGVAFGLDPHVEGPVPLASNRSTQRGPPLNAATNHSIIGGRDLARPSISGTIGGPPKHVNGSISGADFRPRHP